MLSRSSALLIVPALVVSVSSLSAKTTDSRIESAIKNSYNYKSILNDDDIDVKSHRGNVTLTGKVVNYYHKSLAEDTAACMPGVKKVDNRLAVIADQPTEKSDAWLKTKIKTALLFSKNLSSLTTDVDVKDGVALLSGRADSEAQKELTTERVREIEGIKSVQNNMVVGKKSDNPKTLPTKIDDASITAQIKASLLFNKSTSALATNVTTKHGQVYITGEAKSAGEKSLVTKLAEEVRGVKHVNNQMVIR